MICLVCKQLKKRGIEYAKKEAKMNTVQVSNPKNQNETASLEQLRSDFITAINHELRTPLTISKAGVEIILDKLPGDINEKQQELLIVAKKNLERLAKVIDNLPAFILGTRNSLL